MFRERKYLISQQLNNNKQHNNTKKQYKITTVNTYIPIANNLGLTLCLALCYIVSQTTYKTSHVQKLQPPEVSYMLKVTWSSDFMSEI